MCNTLARWQHFMVANSYSAVLFDYLNLSVKFLFNKHTHTHKNVYACVCTLAKKYDKRVLNEGDYDVGCYYKSEHDFTQYILK